jgi:UDPglucose 6-dehydrogenase
MQIAMIGTGYVGLVSGACFAEFGHNVVCVDRDPSRIAILAAGASPFYEPGLADLVARNLAAGRLRFSFDLGQAVPGADIVFIAVGTPSREDGEADLSAVYEAAREIAGALRGYAVIVTKSTVPVGTSREVSRIVHTARPGAEFDVASNPEFLREGSAIGDFMRPDRVVCGTETPRAEQALREAYRPLFLNETPMLFTTIEASELIKYGANAFLSTKITFINEVADLCEAYGVDVQAVARGIGLDRRIGPKFLHPGPGYGGSCFPKDTRALLAMARKKGVRLRIVNAAVETNDQRADQMVVKIKGALGGNLAGATLAVLGVTFKPNTDDVREAPSLKIIPKLQAGGAVIRAFDPKGTEQGRLHLDGVAWCEDAYSAIENADALIILTEWNEFRALDLERVRSLLRQPVVIDLRDIYKPAAMAALGFRYFSVGRPDAVPPTVPK